MKPVLGLVLLVASAAWGQYSDRTLRNSPDAKMAPRSLLLTGGPLDSAKGVYVIEFPPPNECVEIPPVEASSRSMALYVAVSRGGFALAPSNAGLTVWTIEEWDSMKHESSYAEFIKQHAEHCKRIEAEQRRK